MKIKELIEILNKIENQDLEVRLYDDELDSYINFDGDCIEVHEHGCDFNFYKEDRQDDKIKIQVENNMYYHKHNNDFYFECLFCHEEHHITSEYYSHHIFMKNGEVQEKCQNCGSTLFLQSAEV